MDTVFFGYIHTHYNSVEGGVHYFYTPTYKSLLSSIVKYLVDEKLIDPEDYNISFSNAIDFITGGDGSYVSIDGNSDEESIRTFLDDLSCDNLADDSWFEYSAPQGGVIDPDKFVILTIAFNNNYSSEGYDQVYETIACKSENVEKEFKKTILNIFLQGEEESYLPNTLDHITQMINNMYPDQEDFMAGSCLRYRIENVSGDKIAGEDII